MSKLLNLVATTVIGLMFLSSSVAAADDISTSKLDQKELMCLARNIFYESGSESEKGKIAVGMVTLNRTQHPSFPNSVCDVVKQKTVFEKPREIKTIKEVTTGWGIWKKTEQHTEVRTVVDKRVVCQFSWVCAITKRFKDTDQRWVESMSVARSLLAGDYIYYQQEMGNWLYFHSNQVNPKWHNLKRETRVGNHIFYAEKS
jgi:spore germination cell wall hydrolase CwlJ-like protein